MSCRECGTLAPPIQWIQCGKCDDGKMLCQTCYTTKPWHCTACDSMVKPPLRSAWSVFPSAKAEERFRKDLALGRRMRGERALDGPSVIPSAAVMQVQNLHQAASSHSSMLCACPHVKDSDMAWEDEEDDDEVVLEVHYLDVGMGDSTLIICPQSGYTVLIDCGSTLNAKVAGFEALKFVRDRLLALMESRKLPAPQIDRVYITHADRDHYNLLSALLHFKFRKADAQPNIVVMSYYVGGGGDDYNAASANPFPVEMKIPQFRAFASNVSVFSPAFSGEAPQQLDKFVQVQVLSANVAPTHGETPVNASSLCILFSVTTETGIKKLLFMGDAEHTVEEALVKNHNATISNCCSLKLGHHGAQAASNGFFLAKVSPLYVFVSADMQWSHPYTSVIQRVLSVPSMQRFGVNDPSHNIVHGTGGTPSRAYVQESTSSTLFTSLTGFSPDTSGSDKAKKAEQAGDSPVFAEGVQHTLFIHKDGAVGVENAVTGPSGRLTEL
jgi:beta-lactamase superfamily II metal-dependent hydrolase